MTEEAAQRELRAYRRSRQKFYLVAIALFLITCGVLLLLVLKRAPLPLRIIGGLCDVLIGAVLLIAIRQKFREK